MVVALALEVLMDQAPEWVSRGTISIALPPAFPSSFSLPVILQEMALATYFVWFWVRQAATPGMHVFGIEVLQRDGHPMSLAQAVRRFIVLRLSLLALGLPLLLAVRDPRHQGPHDKVADTLVIRSSPTEACD